MTVLHYTPPRSLLEYFKSDKFVNLVVGPVGSTKTTASLIKIAFEAQRIVPCYDGVRRSRVCVIRNTREQLTDTTIPDFLRWFPDGVAGVYLKTERRFLLRFNDVEAEVLFRGLDDANDVRRLLSLQLTFGFMDEFREINQDIFNALGGRLGRYPDQSMNGVGCRDDAGVQIDKIWGCTNPPDFGTFWEEYLSDPPDNAAVFFQPSGMAPEADWLQYLKEGYYENLAEGKSEDWQDVYIHAKFGRSLAGQPVFRAFNRATHVSALPLRFNPTSNQPLLIGVDTALNPAAVIGQLGMEGRLQIFDAVHASGMGALRFCREKLKPLLANKYPGARTLVIMDPAIRRMDTDEQTVAAIFKAEGFAVKPARTNTIAPRIAAVDQFLTRTVDGKPGLLLDPAGCDPLIKALAGKYRYKIKKPGTVDQQVEEDEPEKLHPWSDLADALQYLCMHADMGAVMGAQALPTRREVKPAPYRWAM